MDFQKHWRTLVGGAVVGLFATVVVEYIITNLYEPLVFGSGLWWLQFFVLFYITESLLFFVYAGATLRRPQVPSPEPIPEFTKQVRKSKLNICATSSKPLALWESPTFSLYLIMNGLRNLHAYCQRTGGPLSSVSSDIRAKEEFFDEGMELARQIADGAETLEFFTLRFLVYSRDLYVKKRPSIEALLQAHHVFRMHCIPLVKEELIEHLDTKSRALFQDLTRKLERRRHGRFVRSGIPDMLIVDASDAVGASSNVWSYRRRLPVPSKHLINDARQVFRAICASADVARWDGYTAERIAMVALATPPAVEKPFFSQPYFERWLDRASAPFQEWFQKEIEYLRTEIPSDVAVLDVGCGFGRHMEELVRKCSRVAGVDTNLTMIKSALQRLRLRHDNVEVYPSNADNLPFPHDSFDYVICLTNTFGNMAEDKERILEEMKRVVKPTGKIVISVYKNTSSVTNGRVEDYQAVGLEATASSDGTVATKEGLVSESFDRWQLEEIFSKVGLKAAIRDLNSIALLCELTR